MIEYGNQGHNINHSKLCQNDVSSTQQNTRSVTIRSSLSIVFKIDDMLMYAYSFWYRHTIGDD